MNQIHSDSDSLNLESFDSIKDRHLNLTKNSFK